MHCKTVSDYSKKNFWYKKTPKLSQSCSAALGISLKIKQLNKVAFNFFLTETATRDAF